MSSHQGSHYQQRGDIPFNFSQPPPGGQGFPPTNYPPPPSSYGPPPNVNQNSMFVNPPPQRPPFPAPPQPGGGSHLDPQHQPFTGGNGGPSGQFPAGFHHGPSRAPPQPYQRPPPGPFSSFNPPSQGGPLPYQPSPRPFGPPFAPPQSFTVPPPRAGNFSGPPPGHPSAMPASSFSTPPPPIPDSRGPTVLHGQAQMHEKPKLSNKEQGKQKLELWLQNYRKGKKNPKSEQTAPKGKGPKIWEFIQSLSGLSQQLSSLSSQIEEMDKVVTTADTAAWNEAASRLTSLKNEISSQKTLDFDEQCTEQMEKRLQDRRKKRARMKKARKEKYEESLRQKEDWELKSKIIDSWQEKYTSELREENKKKARKAAADKTLSKVNKEIHDANRLIETMTALQKLRLVRRDAAEKRGDTDLGESRESFEQKIADMIRLVKGQLEFYKEEETRLKNIIKSEVEESNKKEKEILEEKNMARQMQEDEELRTMLFGPDVKVQEDDPMFPFERFYRQAEDNLQSFLSIRHQWDAFLATENTPGASCIPSFWVIPDEPSSSTWASALK